MEYGTGAIMAVPAHDGRDREFAEAYDLPIRPVIDEDGKLIDSGEFDGLPWRDAVTAITDWLDERGFGKAAIHYRLHDWSFSRQRYWGCPIPVVYCEETGSSAVPEDDLPVLLPDVTDYQPRASRRSLRTPSSSTRPARSAAARAKREADTMDTFVDSSWYFLRYTDPHNDAAPFNREIVDYWMPIDQYVGGIDHVKGHLLYSRFFAKVLNDLGLVGFREPFQRLWHQGWVKQGGSKMSKSRGNVSGPDELIQLYGADATRLCILFLGPADQDMDWTPEGVEGMVRFIKRLWRVVGAAADQPASPDGGRHAARAKGARDDRARERRHRPALRLQHSDRGRDGAGQRALEGAGRSGRTVRGRDRRLADPAVRAARGGGAETRGGAPRAR